MKNEKEIELEEIKKEVEYKISLDTAIVYLKRLEELSKYDQEEAHIIADKILLKLVNNSQVEEAFKLINKWYS